MDLYTLNQAGYASLPKMTRAELETAEEGLVNFLLMHDKANAFMMLCKEVSSYTVYRYKDEGAKNYKAMAHEIIDIMKGYGKIKSIEIEDDKVEFWVQNEEACHLYLLFDYSWGVITVE